MSDIGIKRVHLNTAVKISKEQSDACLKMNTSLYLKD